MLNLWLTLPPCPDGDAAPPVPEACPRAGCGGRHLRRHQAVAKHVRHAGLRHAGLRHADLRHADRHRAAGAHRYRCLTCRRTFRVYPDGVDRGTTTVAVKRFAAALHALGLGVRAVSAVLASLGVPIGKSHVHATARRVTAAMPAPEDARLFAGPWGTDASTGRLWITVGGRPRAVRLGAAAGRPALVIEDVDHATAAAVERWARAALGAFGVSAAIVSPPAPRDRGACPGRRGGGGPRRNTTHGHGRSGARANGRSAAAAVDPAPVDPAPVDPTWVDREPGGADDDLPDPWPGGTGTAASGALCPAVSDAVDEVSDGEPVGAASNDHAADHISDGNTELGVLDRPRPARALIGRAGAAQHGCVSRGRPALPGRPPSSRPVSPMPGRAVRARSAARWRAQRTPTNAKAAAATPAVAPSGVPAPA